MKTSARGDALPSAQGFLPLCAHGLSAGEVTWRMCDLRRSGQNVPTMTKKLLVLGSVIVSFIAPSISMAEEVIPPPSILAIDENGVDLISGVAVFPHTTNSIGSGDGGISVTRNRSSGWGYDSNIKSYIKFAFDPDGETGGSTTMVLDGKTQSFEYLGGYDYETYPREEAAGNFKSAYSEGEIVYVAPDGTRAAFYPVTFNSYPDPVTGWDGIRASIIKSVTYPNGEVLKFSFDGNWFDSKAKIESSIGYAVLATPSIVSDNIRAFNLVRGGCSGFSCSGPAYDAQVALGRESILSRNGTIISYQSAAGDNFRTYITSLFRPLGNQGDGRYDSFKVASYSKAGRTWTYSYSFIPQRHDPLDGVMTTTVIAPDGAKRIVRSQLDSGHLLSDQTGITPQRPDGFTTTYQYQYSNRQVSQMKVIFPEGDAFEYEYDGFRNIIRRTHYAKGSLTNKEEVTASYSCRATATTTICNQPDWVRDERGNQTDFTYDPVHGGVLTVTKPAAPNGIRPQIRYAYAQFTAMYVRDGVMQAAAAPVWRVTQTSTCQTLGPAVGTALSPCAGTADEAVTTYAYEPSNVPNNVRLLSTTTRSGNGALSATTTYAYNDRGDMISVDGPLPGTADTTRSYYDASRWKVGEIGPDPDGAGGLLHRATRTTYDADGKVTLVEIGTATDQSATGLSTFVGKAFTRSSYDPGTGLLIKTEAGQP
jgi:hypothetical protein